MEELILKWKEFIKENPVIYINNPQGTNIGQIKEPSFYDFMQWLSKPKKKLNNLK